MALHIRWIWFLYFLLLGILEASSKELRVVCYYTNWSVYRPGSAKFSPQNINPYLCTHLVYAFGGFTKENTLKPFDKYQDIEKGGYAKFTGLKTYNKNLKTMLAIGGWNEGSSRFSPMVASPERRKELVKNVVKFLRQNHFDGLDLDWEYPSFRDGGKPRDRDNYAHLVQELREEFERESEKTGRTRLLLTMAVPAGVEYINKGYDVPKLMKYLDWMNILSYDYHSAFEPSVNHHAPLYPLEEESEYNYDVDLNIDHTIEHYLKMGAISEKLVLGIPTYGRSYTLFNPEANDIGAPADGPGEMGDATRENGYLAYYEICDNVKNEGWSVVQPNDDAMGPYAYKDDQWVGYDDESIARKKAKYVVEKNLGGIMFWAIDNDDFRGTCHNKPYPIIEAAKESLIEAMGLGQENVISKPIKPTKRGRTRPKTTRKESESSYTEKTQNSGGRQSIGNPNSRRRNNRVRTTEKPEAAASSRATRRRRPSSKNQSSLEEPIGRETGSSLVVTTPSYKTPEPPTTPDPGGDFKCEDEGFYPHPRDCKKYFWCLSGPSELGIIAHQFTCPAGLYFNKAAASCDYTQNVLCNKKKSTTPKATTTSKINEASTTKTTTEAPKKTESVFSFSTRRPLPKITAATSRTTFVASTSTTESPEYEDYEYEDEEEEDNNDSEDPRVIKELLELIKKAGGIDELEKQLNLKGDHTFTKSDGTTTQSTIAKKLYERVLAKTKLGDINTKQKYNYINRNSRGPQNEGIHTEEKENSRGRSSRPQYSTISRQKSSKSSEVDTEKENEDEEQEDSPGKSKQYITLKRSRPSSSRNKDEEDDENEGNTEKYRSATISTRSPYVTIRRSRPTTTTEAEEDEEENSYDRKVLGESSKKGENESQTPNYVVLPRGRSTTTESSTSKYKQIYRSTTAADSNDGTTSVTEELSSQYQTPTANTNSITASDTNPNITNYNEETTLNGLNKDIVTSTTKLDIIEPQLLEPRPFSFNNNIRSTTLKPTTTEKATPTSKRSRRPTSRFRPDFRRTRTTTPTPATTTLSERTITTRRRQSSQLPAAQKFERDTTTPKPSRSQNRFRVVTRKHFLRKPTTTEPVNDQERESSNKESNEEQDTSKLSKIAIALQNIQQAPIRSTLSPTSKKISTLEAGRSSKSYEYVSHRINNDLNGVTKVPLVSRTKTPTKPHSTTSATVKHNSIPRTRLVNTFDKILPITSYTYKPISEYEYYDDENTRVVGSIPVHSKVLIHSSGVIQCLDQGNFPHPVSCRKFISCAKMENGNVLGWEYTCAKNLSFDPIGGMCNWSAGLGCNE